MGRCGDKQRYLVPASTGKLEIWNVGQDLKASIVKMAGRLHRTEGEHRAAKTLNKSTSTDKTKMIMCAENRTAHATIKR